MLELKELKSETMTPEEEKGCKFLLDCLIKNQRELTQNKETKPSFLVEAALKEGNDKIADKKGTMLLALKYLLQEVNHKWDLNSKIKLITAMFNSSNGDLIKLSSQHKMNTPEDKRLSQTFQDIISKRNKSEIAHKNLKTSISI